MDKPKDIVPYVVCPPAVNVQELVAVQVLEARTIVNQKL